MAPRWLLLGHQLPTSSSNARVKTWRRLQQIGAVPTRNSVYVLPNTDQCREDFEWIRTEIVALGGEATVFAADAISDRGTDDIVSTFRHTREQDYRALKAEIDRLLSASSPKRRGRARGDGPSTRSLRVLRDRLSAIERIDFFDAPGRADAAAALAQLENTMSAHPRLSTPTHARLSAVSFHSRRWVTRPRPGVDRMASAWLIRRFIDPNATFAFTNRPEGADVPFDMYTGEFSHHGESCTFEVLADRFGLTSTAVIKVGRIVHDLDMKDSKYGDPEVSAVGRLVEGLRATHGDDAALLEQGIAMFDALAHSFDSDSPTPSGRASKRSSVKRSTPTSRKRLKVR